MDFSNLKSQIITVENNSQLRKKDEIACYIERNNIDRAFSRSLEIKELTTQVDIAIHAYGILLALPIILEDDEVVESLSLGAGNTGKLFDLITTQRVAEFKFARWRSHNNTMRQNGIFKDFLELAELSDDSEHKDKNKCIYCFDAEAVIKFLSTSNRRLDSVLSRNPVDKQYPEIADKYRTVSKYYHARYERDIKIVDLSKDLGLSSIVTNT